MIDTIRISADRSEGLLQRLIGLIERRGFAIEAIAMPRGGTAEAELTVTVAARDDSRHTDQLTQQIMRLIGVRTAVADARMHAVTSGGQP